MIEIVKIEGLILCDSCLLDEDVSKVMFDGMKIYLCDECLQELNRKIVEHLAEKNL